MKNKGLEKQISEEIMMMVNSRKTLMLSTLDENNHPYAPMLHLLSDAIASMSY